MFNGKTGAKAAVYEEMKQRLLTTARFSGRSSNLS